MNSADLWNIPAGVSGYGPFIKAISLKTTIFREGEDLMEAFCLARWTNSSGRAYRSRSTAGSSSVSAQEVFSPAACRQTSILALHLCIAPSWLQTVLFKSNFNPISWAVLIRRRLIPISSLDARRIRNLSDGSQFACQVCVMWRCVWYQNPQIPRLWSKPPSVGPVGIWTFPSIL